MVILMFRFNNICRLGVMAAGNTGCTAHGLSGLGTTSFNLGDNGFESDPLYLGSLEVIDNHRSGSGVWTNGHSATRAALLVAHEVGHRQLYFLHSEDDNYAVMNGSVVLTMFGAPERAQLG